MAVAALSAALSPLVFWAFICRLNWGIAGSAVAVDCLAAAELVSLTVYVVWHSYTTPQAAR